MNDMSYTLHYSSNTTTIILATGLFCCFWLFFYYALKGASNYVGGICLIYTHPVFLDTENAFTKIIFSFQNSYYDSNYASLPLLQHGFQNKS